MKPAGSMTVAISFVSLSPSVVTMAERTPPTSKTASIAGRSRFAARARAPTIAFSRPSRISPSIRSSSRVRTKRS